MLLENDIQECLDDLNPLFDEFDTLPEPVRQVLVDMQFKLGTGRFRQFKKMIAAVNARNLVGKRAETLTAMMASAQLPLPAAVKEP